MQVQQGLKADLCAEAFVGKQGQESGALGVVDSGVQAVLGVGVLEGALLDELFEGGGALRVLQEGVDELASQSGLIALGVEELFDGCVCAGRGVFAQRVELGVAACWVGVVEGLLEEFAFPMAAKVGVQRAKAHGGLEDGVSDRGGVGQVRALPCKVDGVDVQADVGLCGGVFAQMCP